MTPAHYLGHRHHLSAICQTCQHAAWLDLAALVARGLGDRLVKDLRFKCQACGSRDVATVVNGRMAWET